MIYANLNTHGSSDYQSFISPNKLKVVVRCTDSHTDIIVMSLDPSKEVHVDELIFQKIASWFQARKFKHPEEAPTLKLSPVLDGSKTSYFDLNYSDYWCNPTRMNMKEAFDFAHERIMGRVVGHTTSLFIGPYIIPNLESLAGITITLPYIPLYEEQAATEDLSQRLPRPIIKAKLASGASMAQTGLARLFKAPAASGEHVVADTDCANPNPIGNFGAIV